jgi:Kef-type K+ transport system membrane component KefB
MNGLLLLMGLLVLSYIGSFLVSGRVVRGVGLPSGAEYVALGFVLGPYVLGILDHSTLESFEPIVHVALGWLALVIGLDFGFAEDRRVRWKSLVLGTVSALLTGAAALAATMTVLRRFPIVQTPGEAWLLAGGLAAVCAETTRHAVQWVIERHGARGQLSNLLNELSHVDDMVPLVAIAVLFALTQKTAHMAHVPFHVPAWGWVGVTILLGLVLGAVAALLIGSEFHVHTTWGVLFGTSLLAVGLATRVGIASLAVMFFMGVAMASVSPHREALRDAVAPTERPVLLPALLLAGARLDFHGLRVRGIVILIAAALGARIVGKLASGLLLRGTRAARGASNAIGLGLASSGALSISIGLAYALRYPGTIGDTVLMASAFAAVFGEFVAPAMLRRVLVQAGEVAENKPPDENDDEPAVESA